MSGLPRGNTHFAVRTFLKGLFGANPKFWGEQEDGWVVAWDMQEEMLKHLSYNSKKVKGLTVPLTIDIVQLINEEARKVVLKELESAETRECYVPAEKKKESLRMVGWYHQLRREGKGREGQIEQAGRVVWGLQDGPT